MHTNKYKDGVGWISDASRHEHYCPGCKDRHQNPKTCLHQWCSTPDSLCCQCKAQPNVKFEDGRGWVKTTSMTYCTSCTKQSNGLYPYVKSQGQQQLQLPTSSQPAAQNGFCPHSTVPVDCRICDSDEKSKRAAIMEIVNMGFTLQQSTQAYSKLKHKLNGNSSHDTELLLKYLTQYDDNNHNNNHHLQIDNNNNNHHHAHNNQTQQQPTNILPPVPVHQHHHIPPQPIPATSLTNETDDDSCKICFEAKMNAVMIPCGHMAVCYDCGKNVHNSSTPNCPICRHNIQSVVQVFKA